MSSRRDLPSLRHARLLSLALAIAVAGTAVGLVLTRGGSDPAVQPGPVSDEPELRAAGADIWSLGTEGSEGWVPSSLDDLAQAADAVVVGQIVDVVDGGPYLSLEGADTGFRQIYLEVRVQEVIGESKRGSIGATIRVDMAGALPDISLDSLRASAPQGRIAFYLYDVFVEASRIAEAQGLSAGAAKRYESTFAPLGSRGVVIEEGGRLVTPLADGGGSLFRSIASFDELVSASRSSRKECDAAGRCLRDVLNPAGSFRGALTDPYPARAKGGAVLPS